MLISSCLQKMFNSSNERSFLWIVFHSLRDTDGSLHDNGSSCDRCHAGKRNVVILPIAEIAGCTAWTHPSPKGANTGAEHRPLLARLLPFPVHRAERHLLDNVRRVYLDTDGNTDRRNNAFRYFKWRRGRRRLVLCNLSARILRKHVERDEEQ